MPPAGRRRLSLVGGPDDHGIQSHGPNRNGGATGTVRWVLRLEGLCALVVAVLVYARQGYGWDVFALFFLVPDLSFLGYLAGPRVGAISYNAAHAYIGAISCLALGYLSSVHVLLVAGIIWCAHIGFDRFLGYGLKYSTGFGFTHLGPIGRISKTVRGRALQQDAPQSSSV